MKRKLFKEDNQAVSPVIATILMVAITVVLAATLYMMIDTGEDGRSLLTGDLSYRSAGSRLSAYEVEGEEWTHQAHARLDISLRSPPNVEEDRIEVIVLNANGTALPAEDIDYFYEFSLLNEDDRVATGTRLIITVTGLEEGDRIGNYETVIRVPLYDGTISQRFG